MSTDQLPPNSFFIKVGPLQAGARGYFAIVALTVLLTAVLLSKVTGLW